MSVKQIPQKFESHGREFDTPEEATRYDALCIARETLEKAQRAFQRLLGDSAKTADGISFEFGLFNTYWHVVTPFHTMPYLQKYGYYGRDWSVKEDGETIEIRQDSGEKRSAAYVPISELFRFERSARFALLVAMEKWLIERTKEIEDYRDELKKQLPRSAMG